MLKLLTFLRRVYPLFFLFFLSCNSVRPKTAQSPSVPIVPEYATEERYTSYLFQAQHLMSEKEFVKAKNMLHTAKGIWPNEPETHYRLSKVYMALSQSDSALLFAQNALSLDKKSNIWYVFQVKDVLLAQNKDLEALAVLEKNLPQFIEFKDFILELDAMYASSKQWNKKEKLWQNVLKNSKGSEFAKRGLASTYYKQNKFSELYPIAKELVETNDFDGDYLAWRAWAMYHKGSKEELKLFLKAKSSMPMLSVSQPFFKEAYTLSKQINEPGLVLSFFEKSIQSQENSNEMAQDFLAYWAKNNTNTSQMSESFLLKITQQFPSLTLFKEELISYYIQENEPLKAIENWDPSLESQKTILQILCANLLSGKTQVYTTLSKDFEEKEPLSHLAFFAQFINYTTLPLQEKENWLAEKSIYLDKDNEKIKNALAVFETFKKEQNNGLLPEYLAQISLLYSLEEVESSPSVHEFIKAWNLFNQGQELQSVEMLNKLENTLNKVPLFCEVYSSILHKVGQIEKAKVWQQNKTNLGWE